MTPIISSLGSNYPLSFATRSFFEFLRFYWSYLADVLGIEHDDWQTLNALKSKLETEYGGQAFLVYKGRDAVEFALRAYGIEAGDTVLTQAFSCHAIEEGIVRAGAVPVYVDIDQDTHNLNLATVSAANKKNPRVKAVLVQHTLGYSADIQAIAGWCKKHSVLLIEDLAQAIGGYDRAGAPLGTYGQAVVFSFGRDKVLDGVSGGAVVCKDMPTAVPLPHIRKVSPLVVTRDLFYPIITWKIRHTLWFGLGRVIMLVAKKVRFLTNPVASPTNFIAHLPRPLAELVIWQYERLEQQLVKRRQRAARYWELCARLSKRYPKVIQMLASSEVVAQSSNVRFSIWIDDPDQFIVFCKRRQFIVSDRWYRRPVDFGALDRQTVYPEGSCPEAEALAAHVINLPTHQAISDANMTKIESILTEYCQFRTELVRQESVTR